MGEHKRPPRQSPYRARLRHEVREGVIFGAILASIYCAFALVVFLLRGSSSFDHYGVSLGTVLGAYVIAGLGAGLLVGIMHPLKGTLPGQLALGLTVALLTMLLMHVAMYGLPSTWTSREWESVAVLGLIFGIAGTFIFRKA